MSNCQSFLSISLHSPFFPPASPPLAAFDEKDFRRWAAGSPLCAPLVDGPRSLPPNLAAPLRLPDRDYTVRADEVQKAPSCEGHGRPNSTSLLESHICFISFSKQFILLLLLLPEDQAPFLPCTVIECNFHLKRYLNPACRLGCSACKP